MKKLFENWKRYTEEHENTGTVLMSVGDGRALHIPSSIFTWIVENQKIVRQLIDHLEKMGQQAKATSTPDEMEERKLSPEEEKKKEEVVKAIKRDNPEMDKGKAYAIATATAKKSSKE